MRFAIRLLLGSSWLSAACAGDSPTIVLPSADTTPRISVTVLPDSLSLNPGQTRLLTAVISGIANQAVTWSSSDDQVATVAASGQVSAIGKIGAAVITATAVGRQDRGSSVVYVISPPPGPRPTVSIQSIRAAGTTTPLLNSNVRGAIQVIVDLTVPSGSDVKRVEFSIDGNVLPECTQSVGTGSIATQESPATEDVFTQIGLNCQFNTAAYDPVTGAVSFANGARILAVRAIAANESVAAQVSTQITLTNPNFLIADIQSTRAAVPASPAPRSVALPNSPWRAGSISVAVQPVLFSNATGDSLASVSVLISTSGQGVSGIDGCMSTGVSASGIGTAAQDPTIARLDGGGGFAGANNGATPNCVSASGQQTDADPGNGIAMLFPETNSLTSSDAGGNGVAGVEDELTFRIVSVTRSGAPGPACINPHATANPLLNTVGVTICGAGVTGGSTPFAVFLSAPWRHDNLAPRFTSLNIIKSPDPLFFSNQAFASAAGAAAAATVLGARTVDYGVGHQTDDGKTSFRAGTALSSTATISNTNALPEAGANYLLQAVASDGLNNLRRVTATTQRLVVASATGEIPSGSGVLLQNFGVDLGPPTLTVLPTSPPDNGLTSPAAAPATFSLKSTDIGLSGFGATPFAIKAELITATGSSCYNLEAVAIIDCADTFASNGMFGLAPGINGYWKLTATVSDRAGNSSSAVSRLHLVDGIFPAATITNLPATISGGQSVSFVASLFDNVELKSHVPAIVYQENSVNFTIEDVVKPLGTYGLEELTAQHAAHVTIQRFMRSIETTLPTGIPSNAIARATFYTELVSDLAGNTSGQSSSILAGVMAGIGGTGNETSWSSSGRPFDAVVNAGAWFLNTSTPTSLCVDTDGDGCSTPRSRTVSATAAGPIMTFADPFAQVDFYYQHPLTGRYSPIGTGVAATSLLNNAIRSVTYTATFTPPQDLPAGTVYRVIAIGTDALGRGLVTGVVNFIQIAD